LNRFNANAPERWLPVHFGFNPDELRQLDSAVIAFCASSEGRNGGCSRG
jgi:hypothetical protein